MTDQHVVEDLSLIRPLGETMKRREEDVECDKNNSSVDLKSYPQWKAEVGYWIGEYSFYGADGNPNVSPSWNYPYGSYVGFITGNVEGPSYRQRNVFLYPPQDTSICELVNNSTIGDGECGINGNTKIFEADQTAGACSTEGTIEGPYQGYFNTKTELIGRENALLYQVFLNGAIFGLSKDLLYQSQLTTITKAADGSTRRTRTAQGFEAFNPVSIDNTNLLHDYFFLFLLIIIDTYPS